MNFYWPQCDSPRMRLRKENHSLIISYDNSAGRNDGFRSWKLTKFQVLIPISLVPIRHVFLDKNHMDHMYSLLGNFETSKLGTMKWGREPFRRGKIVQRAYCNEGLPFQSTLRRICDQNCTPGNLSTFRRWSQRKWIVKLLANYKKWHDFVGILDWGFARPHHFFPGPIREPLIACIRPRPCRLQCCRSFGPDGCIPGAFWIGISHPFFLFLPKPSEVMLPLVA